MEEPQTCRHFLPMFPVRVSATSEPVSKGAMKRSQHKRRQNNTKHYNVYGSLNDINVASAIKPLDIHKQASKPYI